MESMPCDSINPEEQACTSSETRRECWSPLELLPRDLFSKIIDYVPESVLELRMTSRTIQYRVDDYAIQRPTSTLIAQLELFSNYYGSNSNHWLVGKVHVDKCKSHLFELRLRIRQPSCHAHTPIRRTNVDDTRAVYKFEINVLSDARAMWAYLLESMGNRAENVVVRQCETVRLLDVALQILEGIKVEKLKVVIENLLDGLEKYITHIVRICGVDQIYLFVTVVNLNDPAKFLLELSSYARAIHIYHYDIQFSHKIEHRLKSKKTYLLGKTDLDWAPVIVEMFLRKLNKLRIENYRQDRFLSLASANFLKENLPLIGKKVWFVATCNAYGQAFTEMRNEHIVQVYFGRGGFLRIKHSARENERFVF